MNDNEHKEGSRYYRDGKRFAIYKGKEVPVDSNGHLVIDDKWWNKWVFFVSVPFLLLGGLVWLLWIFVWEYLLGFGSKSKDDSTV